MSIQRLRPQAALVAASILGLALLVGVPTVQAADQPSSTPVAKLFVQDAQSATAERIRGKRWRITLTDVNSTTLWFADRPVRDAGRQTTGSFVREWNKYGFAADPPNAVIQHSDSDGVAVELKNPRYDRKAATLTYTALIDPGSKQRLSRQMSDVSVFIDDAEQEPGVTSTLTVEIQNIPPTGRFTLVLAEPSGEPDPVYAAFVQGDDNQNDPLISFEGSGANIPIVQFSVTPTQVAITTGVPDGDADGNSLLLTIPVTTAPNASTFQLTYFGPSQMFVSAQLNNGVSQELVASEPTIFELAP